MAREFLPILVIIVMFAIAYYSEPRLITNQNGEVISHWNFTGGADGWMNKTLAVYLFPAMTLIFYAILFLIPKIEVYKKNLEYFADQFWGFKVIFVFVMCAIYVASLLPNLGYWPNFDPQVIVIPAVALMFFYVGYMLTFTKRNYFIGIRTPWTLASEEVWDKTNKLASKLFWAAGVLTFVALIAPADLRLWLILLPLIAIVFGVYAYSLAEYNKIMGGRHESGRKPKAKAKKARKK